MIFINNILYTFNLESLTQSRRLQSQLFQESHRWRVPAAENSANELTPRVRNLSVQRIHLLNGIIYTTIGAVINSDPYTRLSINVRNFLDYHTLLNELAQETLESQTEVTA